MKKLIENFIIIMVLTIAILFSYALIEKKISGRSSSEFINFLFSTQEKASSNKSSVTSNKGNSKKGNNSSTQSADTMNYRAVWLSYLEFNSYRKSVKNNNESSFRKFYKHILQQIKTIGCNRIIVQVRPFGDALYASDYFPWAACISGTQGKNPGYDPLKIMTEMSHKEGISIEAWINPYRISSGNSIRSLSKTNPARKWFSVQNTKRNILSYEGSLYYNPSSESVRNLIIQGVKEIVQNYNVDGIHMDDYFYPYPNPGEDFPDHVSFAQYGRGYSNKADWRRDNVNVLIKEIHETVRECKPWVKFGVSPFGIYRNKKNDPNGSDTRGLQNYDDLYADVLMWINNGWVDYNIPQIYWEIGHPAADYDNLIHWWAKHAASRPLFIGQDVMRTVNKADARNPLQNQMPAKMKLQRSLPTVQGSCQWYAAAVVDNAGNYRTMLEKEYHRYPALIPESPFMDDKAPGKVKKVKMVWTYEGPVLFWTAPKAKDEMDKAVQYVVYRFDKKEKVNLDDASHIVAITRDHFYPLPYNDGKTKYQYVVTALDRLHNESKGTKKKVKL